MVRSNRFEKKKVLVFLILKEIQSKKMDLNNYINFSSMQIGHYDTITKKLTINRNRLIMNRICITISIICALKNLAIVFEFLENELIFYLIELYIFDGKAQKIFSIGKNFFNSSRIILRFDEWHNSLSSFDRIGVFFLHTSIVSKFYFWGCELNENSKLLESLDFLYIIDLKKLIQTYDLEPKSTEKFIKKSQIYIFSMNFLIASFIIFFFSLILRCIYYSIINLNIFYLIIFGLFFSIITFYEFYLIALSEWYFN